MSWKTPLAADGVLRAPLDAEQIELGTHAWFAWLASEAHSSFHFMHPSGGFTARKERKQRGQAYWVAYRQVHHKLYKAYLGKSECLTEARLSAASESLAERASPNGASGSELAGGHER
jgi:LuxR family maltose regulon positive regulatory protein